MKLYLISQDVNNDYDTYDSAVVSARTVQEAGNIHPGGEPLGEWYVQGTYKGKPKKYASWAYEPDEVKVEYLGEARGIKESKVICSSYNAG